MSDGKFRTYLFLALRLGAPLSWSAIILWLSLTSFPPQIPGFLGWDKLLHSGAYALLTLLIVQLLIYLRQPSANAWLFSGVTAVGYGALLEILQLQMQRGRTAEWWDLVADAVGALLAYAIFCHGPRIICSSDETTAEKYE